MISPLDVGTRGYLDSPLSVAARGYLTLPVVTPIDQPEEPQPGGGRTMDEVAEKWRRIEIQLRMRRDDDDLVFFAVEMIKFLKGML